MPKLDWLTNEHPIYAAWKDHWRRGEKLLRGGVYVKDELARFDWETAPSNADPTGIGQNVSEVDERVAEEATISSRPLRRPGEHYEMRQRQAVYMNFPDLFATVTVGHIMKKAPQPGEDLSFGQLGEVARATPEADPSPAELVYYNTDGVGNDGSQWDNYWGTSLKRATATGHRWHIVEATEIAPQTRRDVMNGLRPYMIELSPLAVPNWEYDKGVLQWAVVLVPNTRVKMVDGTMERQQKADYLLMVRKGYTEFDGEMAGVTFSTGGWWLFDSDQEYRNQTGAWDKTKGEVPLFPLFWERDDGTDELPAMSRPANMEIQNAAVAFMNLSSAVNFELWDGAKGIRWLRGIDDKSWNLAMNAIAAGAQYVPLAVAEETPTVLPDVSAPTGATNEVVTTFIARLKEIREEVKELMSFEASGTADSSGFSKQAGFGERKAPRLANVASELEQSQNTAIMFLELRFNKPDPIGQTAWTREFELIDMGQRLKDFFEMQNTAGVISPTATARGLTQAADDAGLVSDDETRKKIQSEYEKAVKDKNTQEAQAAALLNDVDRKKAGTQDGPIPPAGDFDVPAAA